MDERRQASVRHDDNKIKGLRLSQSLYFVTGIANESPRHNVGATVVSLYSALCGKVRYHIVFE